MSLSFDLCHYKNALGKPKEGLHSYRILGFAAWDVFLTIVGGGLIAYMSGWSTW